MISLISTNFPRNFTLPLAAIHLGRLARLTLLPVLVLAGLALGMGTSRADDLLITNGTSSNFSSGTNSYGTIFVGTSEGVVNGNNLTVVNTNTKVSSAELTVGYTGSGNSLTISAGASVVADIFLSLGLSAGSDSNSIVVTGTGSSLGVGDLAVGYFGNTGNTLEVSAGGSLTSYNASFNGSSNAVLVTGSGSTWTNSGDLIVGEGGLVGGNSVGNSFVISNGGAVQNDTGYIGFNSRASKNSVLVKGAGSLWSNSNTLMIGRRGSGTLTLADGAMVQAANGITIASQTGSSGTLNIGGFGANDTAGTIIASTITFGLGNGIINFNQSDSTTVLAVISGAGSVNQRGSGITILSGANTYSGGTMINRGTVALNNSSSLGTGMVTFASNNTTLLANTNVSVGNNIALTTNGTLDSGADNLTASGAISGAGALIKAGSGTVSLTSSNTYTGGTILNVGTLAISNNYALGTGTLTFASDSTTLQALANLNIANKIALTRNGTIDSGAYTVTNSGVIAGEGALTKVGTGTMVLSANNTYSGQTFLSDGGLNISSISSIGAGNLNFNSIGTSKLSYSGGTATLANNISVSSGTGVIANKGMSSLNLSGNIANNNSTLVLDGGSFQVSGNITGSSLSTLSLSSASATLTGSGNLYTGATTLLGGSTLTLGVANGISTNSSLTLGSSGDTLSTANTLDLSGYSQGLTTIRSEGLGYNSVVNSSASLATLTLTGFNNSTYGGSINGNIALVAANGTANLFGVNSYTGTTSVGSGARINLTNSGSLTGTTGISLTGGTLLLGAANQVKSGIDVEMTSGSTLSMGGNGSSRASEQTFGTLTLTGNSTIDFANLTGGSSLTFGSMSLGSYSLTILNWSGTNESGTTSAGAPTKLVNTSGSLTSGTLDQIYFFGTEGQFMGQGNFSGTEIVPVPEPSVILTALLLLGSLTYGLRRSRNKSTTGVSAKAA